MSRKQIVDADLSTYTSEQSRFTKVNITALKSVEKVGLLKDYKSLSTNADYIEFLGVNTEGDIGRGIYYKVNTTEPHDRGVILNIRGVKYKRIFSGEVYLEWFSDDFVSALVSASKYNHIRLLANKVYTISRSFILQLDADLFIDMNSAILYSELTDNYAFTIDFRAKCAFSITKGIVELTNATELFSFRNAGNATLLDCITMVRYTPASVKPNTDGIIELRDSQTIDITKTFTQPIIVQGQVFSDNSMVTNGYIGNSQSGADIVRLNEDADIPAQIFSVAPVIPSEPVSDNSLVTEAYLEVLAEQIFTRLTESATFNVIEYPIGSFYIQFAHNGTFRPQDEPEQLFIGTVWTEYLYPSSENILLGLSSTAKSGTVTTHGTQAALGVKTKLWQRVAAKLTPEEIASFTLNPLSASGSIGDQVEITVTSSLSLNFTYKLVATDDKISVADNMVTLLKPGASAVTVIIAVAKGSSTQYITKSIPLQIKMSDIVLTTDMWSNGEVSWLNDTGSLVKLTVEFTEQLWNKIAPDITRHQWNVDINWNVLYPYVAIFYVRIGSTIKDLIVEEFYKYSCGYYTQQGSTGVDRISTMNQDKLGTFTNSQLQIVNMGPQGGCSFCNDVGTISLPTTPFAVLPGETFVLGCKSIRVTNNRGASLYSVDYNSSGRPSKPLSNILLHPILDVPIDITSDMLATGEYSWFNGTGETKTIAFEFLNAIAAFNFINDANDTVIINVNTNEYYRAVIILYLKRDSVYEELLCNVEKRGIDFVRNDTPPIYHRQTGIQALISAETNKARIVNHSSMFTDFCYCIAQGTVSEPIQVLANETITIGFKYFRSYYQGDTDPFSYSADTSGTPCVPSNTTIRLKFL